MLRILSIAALVSLPVAAMAQEAPAQTSNAAQQAETGHPPQRVRSVTLTGNEPCPKGSGDEVVVCSRIAPGEQYRVPKALRQSRPSSANNSWVNRAATLDDIGRRAGGLPDTCSPVGTGGQSGCALQANQQYAAEKAEKKREDSSIP